MNRLLIVAAMIATTILSNGQSKTARPIHPAAPLVDHHQHLFSPAMAAVLSTPDAPFKPIFADDLVPLLDAAGIERAVVLSTAYIYGQPRRKVENEYDKVRAENDWTSQQVAQYPDRLIGFCSFNPLRDFAFDELARCAKDPNLKTGLKLHFGNSAIDYHDAKHIEYFAPRTGTKWPSSFICDRQCR